MMLWGKFKELIMFTVHWFWKKYRNCVKKNETGKMVLLFLFSLTGIAVTFVLVGFAVVFLIQWSMTYPLWAAAIGAVIWLYIKGKDKEELEDTAIKETIEKKRTVLEAQAEQGYATMLNVVYQTFRTGAGDVGGVTPTFMGEVEMPDGHYRISNGIVFYNFKLQKQDANCIYDAKMLNEFKQTLQYLIHNKLHSGAFPTVSIVDYRDAHGGMDGIVVHTLEDYGMYLAVYTVYAMPEYSEYRHQQELTKTQRSEGNKELTTSWDDLK